ncbi:MAG: hypothetical protein OEO79_14780 [Gemmatimonadota bacterium]|nr:hypothetical protein [Gemmatimonadota bacterium]
MRRSDALQEMMRLARSIVLDGEVTDMEAKVFHAWIERNPDVKGIVAVDEIIGILTNVFADGRLNDTERTQLVTLLEEFGG